MPAADIGNQLRPLAMCRSFHFSPNRDSLVMTSRETQDPEKVTHLCCRYPQRRRQCSVRDLTDEF